MIDRIKQVIEYVQMSPSAFADTIGISRSGMTHLLTGRNQPSLDVARKILAKYPELSTEWLIMGMGEMFRSEEENIPASNEEKSELSQNSYPDENSKFDRQTDLFGEFEKAEESDEDIAEPQSAPENDAIETEIVAEPVLTPQMPSTVAPTPSPVPASAPVPPPAQSRARTKPATTMNRREKSASNPVTQEKKLQKIVFFYDDHSFEVFSAC